MSSTAALSILVTQTVRGPRGLLLEASYPPKPVGHDRFIDNPRIVGLGSRHRALLTRSDHVDWVSRTDHADSIHQEGARLRSLWIAGAIWISARCHLESRVLDVCVLGQGVVDLFEFHLGQRGG